MHSVELRQSTTLPVFIRDAGRHQMQAASVQYALVDGGSLLRGAQHQHGRARGADDTNVIATGA